MLVTVICLCHNQARFVGEALQSVQWQTYPHVELIVVDDASTDGSAEVIEQLLAEWKTVQPAETPDVPFVRFTENQGVCAAFNAGLRLAHGEFVIDLAADDVLLPDRIEKQVAAFDQLDKRYGVVFSNAEIINEDSETIGVWYEPNDFPIPTGDIYQSLFERSFICTPTMMTRRAVYEELGGYDESLSYEDFDFWVRSARRYRYHYLDEITTRKRRVPGSASMQFYQRGPANAHLRSTLAVCRKAYRLNRFDRENRALAVCVRYHLRQALFTDNHQLAAEYASLLETLTDPSATDRMWLQMARLKVPLSGLYRQYLRIRHPEVRL
jgi:glycosyltransferase involved in cell wall biosynthesis